MRNSSLRFCDDTELATGNKTGYVFNLNHTVECSNINFYNIRGFNRKISRTFSIQLLPILKIQVR